ncbi:MAG: surface-adhesin E family protein [Sterolibacterium sp.]|jgi:hypothetical protein
MATRTAILMALLIAASSSARAEWVETASDANATGYADPSTVSRVLGVVKMWELVDYKTTKTFNASIRPVSFRSTVSQVEYDCAENKLRRVAQTFFSGKMAEDSPVYANPTHGEWVAIRPGSNGEAMWKVACGNK